MIESTVISLNLCLFSVEVECPQKHCIHSDSEVYHMWLGYRRVDDVARHHLHFISCSIRPPFWKLVEPCKSWMQFRDAGNRHICVAGEGQWNGDCSGHRGTLGDACMPCLGELHPLTLPYTQSKLWWHSTKGYNQVIDLRKRTCKYKSISHILRITAFVS